jgi:hypothetical protein
MAAMRKATEPARRPATLLVLPPWSCSSCGPHSMSQSAVTLSLLSAASFSTSSWYGSSLQQSTGNKLAVSGRSNRQGGASQAPAAPRRAPSRSGPRFGAKTALHRQFSERMRAGRHFRKIVVLGRFARPRCVCPVRGAPGDLGPCSGALWARWAQQNSPG